jgi:hypothetical protein
MIVFEEPAAIQQALSAATTGAIVEWTLPESDEPVGIKGEDQYYFCGLQLQFSCTLATGRKPLVQPALLLGPPAVGRSRSGVNQPRGGRGAAHQRWFGGTH